MKSKQIKSMSQEDIRSKLQELRKEQIKLNAQKLSGTTMKDPAMVRKTKKTIARLLQQLKEE